MSINTFTFLSEHWQMGQCRRHEMQVQSLGWEDPLEEGMATHSSILAWRVPGTEGPGGLHLVHRAAKSWTSLK